MTKLFWLQAGACGGDSMALLNTELPNLPKLFSEMGIELLWHPSFCADPAADQRRLIQSLLDESIPLDILCLEGFAVCGPEGSGLFDTLEGKPKKDLILALASKARYVVAAGTCASFGGLGTGGDAEGAGLQFVKQRPGGLLGAGYVSREGLPVINLPGCPVHPSILADTLLALTRGDRLPLDEFQQPADWYGTYVHQGCIRNEYHEYRVEEHEFGGRGCLFFFLGCRGPLTRAPCNKILWNRRSSKTNAGMPCVGCTSPGFPQDQAFFRTRTIVGVPIELPDGVDRAHYLAYKGIAATAAPKRLKDRSTPL